MKAARNERRRRRGRSVMNSLGRGRWNQIAKTIRNHEIMRITNCTKITMNAAWREMNQEKNARDQDVIDEREENVKVADLMNMTKCAAYPALLNLCQFRVY